MSGNIVRAVSTLIFIILMPAVSTVVQAQDLGCGWLKSRQERNRPNATEAQKAELWEYERRTLKNTCSMSYEQYSASGAKKPKASSDTKTTASGRAPYADPSCVEFKPSGSGITSDNVSVTNRCSFPIQVLHCFYRQGESSKCHPSTGNRWGTTSTIAPGGRTISIAYQEEWDVAYYVCNMSGVKKSSKLCLRPK